MEVATTRQNLLVPLYKTILIGYMIYASLWDPFSLEGHDGDAESQKEIELSSGFFVW